MKILSAAEMQACDRATSEQFGVGSLTLMRNASASVAACARALFPNAKRVTVLCGRGNNGGDGMMIARLLAEAGLEVSVLLLGAPDGLKGDAAEAWRQLREAGQCNVHVIEDAAQFECHNHALHADLLVDAVVGTGFRPPLKGLPMAALEWVQNQASGPKAHCGSSVGYGLEPMPFNTGVPILAVDLPSGWPADETKGSVDDPVFPADAVVTFTAPKPAHVFGELTRHWDQPVVVAPIGSPEEAMVSKLNLHWAGLAQDLIHAPRAAAANKGNFGHVLVVGGSFGASGGKAGAPSMTAMAALRAGAGLVTTAVPETALPVVAGFVPELMTLPLEANVEGEILPMNAAAGRIEKLLKGITVLAVGPGMGQSTDAQKFLELLLLGSRLPVVIDADGLNLLAKMPDLLGRIGRERTVVLTPHPGEMARLAGIATRDVQADRLGAARSFAVRHHVTLVLKGARTIIAHPDGRVAVNTSGNPGMAKGGSGDVLTGIVAAMLGQFPDNPGRAVEAAVFLHGVAADLAVRDGDEHTLLATDSFRYFSQAFRFRSRTANGYVWLQGLPRRIPSAMGTREAAE